MSDSRRRLRALFARSSVALWCVVIDDTYRAVETSLALPILRPSELKRFLDLYHTTDQNSILRQVRQWARTLPG